MSTKSHTKKKCGRLRIKLFSTRRYVEIHIQRQFFSPFKFMTLPGHPHKLSTLAHLPHDICILSSVERGYCASGERGAGFLRTGSRNYCQSLINIEILLKIEI
jgi:hypothetical protein